MKVFICWSGELSKLVAAELRDWLPDVIQSVEPFFSDDDIESGSAWFQKIDEEIKDTYFGILCLTQENRHSHWIHYEAGGLRKGIGENRVAPFLIDLTSTDLNQPLAALQMNRADKDGVAKLLRSINGQVDSEYKLTPERLDRAFELNWTRLESQIKAAIDKTAVTNKKGVLRTPDDKMDEILSLVRRLVKGRDTEKLSLFKNLTLTPGTGELSTVGQALTADVTDVEKTSNSENDLVRILEEHSNKRSVESEDAVRKLKEIFADFEAEKSKVQHGNSDSNL